VAVYPRSAREEACTSCDSASSTYVDSESGGAAVGDHDGGGACDDVAFAHASTARRAAQRQRGLHASCGDGEQCITSALRAAAAKGDAT
jgi:hypothetical protein